MAHLRLSSHGHAPADVDQCPACRLVWFDALESVQLDGMGWVRLLRELRPEGAPSLPPPAQAASPCPTCHDALRPVHNRTRFGRFQVLECPKRHGHLHSHSGLLAERGLVRPLLGPERRALAEERHRIDCLNCGAPSDGRSEDCAYCGSPLVVVDLPRLSQALRIGLRRAEGAVEDTAVARPAPGRTMSWACRGCGSALDPSQHTHCPQCGHLVVAPTLLDITTLLDAAEADLKAAAAAAARATERRAAARQRLGGEARQRERVAARRPAGFFMGWGPLFAAIAACLIWWMLS